MSDIYAADLDPSKPSAVAQRLTARFGVDVSADDVRMLSSFRFDDPAGEVGCETHLVSVSLPERGDVIVQVPLTYRGAPLEGAPADALVTTMRHSVLGDRWVYDAAHDPVYVTELLLTMTDARSAAEQYAVSPDGSRMLITEGLAEVRGTGPVLGSSSEDSSQSPGGAGGTGGPTSGQQVLPAVETSGDSTSIRLRGAQVRVFDILRVPTASAGAPGAGAAGVAASGQLIGTWDAQESPVTLAEIVI